jgi:hypothetical protein
MKTKLKKLVRDIVGVVGVEREDRPGNSAKRKYCLKHHTAGISFIQGHVCIGLKRILSRLQFQGTKYLGEYIKYQYLHNSLIEYS